MKIFWKVLNANNEIFSFLSNQVELSPAYAKVLPASEVIVAVIIHSKNKQPDIDCQNDLGFFT